MVTVVVDYGMGNLRSVAKAIEHVAGGAPVCVSDDPDTVLAAARVVFPGQGAARDCMAALQAHGGAGDRLGRAVRVRVEEALAGGRPFLGICMGMQVLFEHSAENAGVKLLGLLPGQVEGFLAQPGFERGLKVPHMGWNTVRQTRPHPLWHGIGADERFYFVHSYFVRPAEERLQAGETEYGLPFCAAVAAGGLFACQFHPEKSAEAGLKLLANFMSWEGTA